MTMPNTRGDRENQKFVETDAGDTSVRTVAYGITSGGAILPIRVDADGKLVVTT